MKIREGSPVKYDTDIFNDEFIVSCLAKFSKSCQRNWICENFPRTLLK